MGVCHSVGVVEQEQIVDNTGNASTTAIKRLLKYYIVYTQQFRFAESPVTAFYRQAIINRIRILSFAFLAVGVPIDRTSKICICSICSQ